MENLRNWAGNYTYSAARLHRPETVEQVQDLVRGCSRLKVLGTRHCFNDIADTTEDLVSLERFDQVLALDTERRTVTVGAGIRYGTLCGHLDRAGYALHNLASLPHISVAGSCATATHGSGVEQGNLATVVSAMEMVTGEGEVVTLSRERDGDTFAVAVVGLGGLGAITRVTLDIVPAFAMRQDVYEDLALARLEDDFEEIVSSGYSVSLFTDWRGDRFTQVWRKRRVAEDEAAEAEPTWFGARRATEQLHPIPGMPPRNCTQQMGIPGPWHERLPHFRMEFTPSSGEELQSEYLLPRRHAWAALSAVYGLREHVAPILQISEVRTVAADDLWMSPCYRRDCVALHFTWIQDWPAVRAVLPLIEDVLAPFDARPHWGKLWTMSAERLQSLYEKLPDFQALLRRFDPQGKFRNAFLDTYIVGAQ